MTILNEFESKKLLEQSGINVSKGYFVPATNYHGIPIISDEISNALGFIGAKSYVVKIVSKNVPHKSDAGGVIINVPTADVFKASEQVIRNVIRNIPDAKIDGVYIQEFVPEGIECIIGVKEDPQFGRVIMFGLGGIYAEVFKDISMRVLPITEDNALEMITETKVYRILNGARGKRYDITGIVDTLIKVSILSEIHNISELDINPLIVHEKGVKVIDARILISDSIK